ncbi:hypothetical protein M3Y97_00996400 [Aphelenchoides bicaudatus]|nr:hypothetical protein M3Y97_00996400 [Aphelenchoides bicaudatus]
MENSNGDCADSNIDKDNESGISDDITDRLVELLQLQMPNLLSTDAWKKLPSWLQNKSTSKTTPEVRRNKAPTIEDQPDASVRQDIDRFSLDKDEPRERKAVDLITTYLTRCIDYNRINPFTKSQSKFRTIELHNIGLRRLAYQIKSARMDQSFRATNVRGFLEPGERVASEVKFNKHKGTIHVLYKESTSQYNSYCSQSNGVCKN